MYTNRVFGTAKCVSCLSRCPQFRVSRLEGLSFIEILHCTHTCTCSTCIMVEIFPCKSAPIMNSPIVAIHSEPLKEDRQTLYNGQNDLSQ